MKEGGRRRSTLIFIQPSHFDVLGSFEFFQVIVNHANLFYLYVLTAGIIFRKLISFDLMIYREVIICRWSCAENLS